MAGAAVLRPHRRNDATQRERRTNASWFVGLPIEWKKTRWRNLGDFYSLWAAKLLLGDRVATPEAVVASLQEFSARLDDPSTRTESGLEPYRLSHLVKYLKTRVEEEELQVIFTTHSSLVVESLLIGQMFIVRCDPNGRTTIVAVPPELSSEDADVMQGIARERPSSLLSRKVIVGEGATEVGVLRTFLWSWDSKRTKMDESNSVTAGISVANGSGGSQAPGRAKALALLGYPTLLVIDGDVTSNKAEIQAAVDAGALLVQWPEGCALEDVICASLSVLGLQKYVDFAVEDKSEESVVSSVNNFLSSVNISGTNVAAWIEAADEDDVRSAISQASKGAKKDGTKTESKAWFKREDRGESLGMIVVEDSQGLMDGSLLDGIEKIKKFVYDLAESVDGD